MSAWEQAYLDLCEHVLSVGLREETRVGPARSVLGTSLSIYLPHGEFPLLTTRKMFPRPVFGELAAFLKGATHNGDFIKEGCNYWTANARAWPKQRLDSTDEQLFLGPVYGAEWRNFNAEGWDQLRWVQSTIKTDPGSRRLVVTAWNPLRMYDICLPPCHITFQYHVRAGKLHCSMYMRSVDLCLGLPSDVVLYYALLIAMAHDVKLDPGSLHFHFGNAHVYEAHLEPLRVQLGRTPGRPPVWYPARVPAGPWINDFSGDDIIIRDYNPQEALKYELLV